MASRTSINISGHYVVSVNAMHFHICTLNPKNEKSTRIVFYMVFKNQRPSDTVF